MQPTSALNLRKWERETIAIPASIVLRADKSDSEIATTIVDISLCGVAIRTEVELVPNQELEIVITGEFSRAMPARVVWVRRDQFSQGTIVGLKFLAYSIELAS
jgi:hypothetical protein